jgi:hypothetical protein
MLPTQFSTRVSDAGTYQPFSQVAPAMRLCWEVFGQQRDSCFSGACEAVARPGFLGSQICCRAAGMQCRGPQWYPCLHARQSPGCLRFTAFGGMAAAAYLLLPLCGVSFGKIALQCCVVLVIWGGQFFPARVLSLLQVAWGFVQSGQVLGASSAPGASFCCVKQTRLGMLAATHSCASVACLVAAAVNSADTFCGLRLASVFAPLPRVCDACTACAFPYCLSLFP